MEGACSNQVVKCIVWTNDLELGIKKLKEIEKEKNNSGIQTVSKGHMDANISFMDGEEWIIAKPCDKSRGYA